MFYSIWISEVFLELISAYIYLCLTPSSGYCSWWGVIKHSCMFFRRMKTSTFPSLPSVCSSFPSSRLPISFSELDLWWLKEFFIFQGGCLSFCLEHDGERCLKQGLSCCSKQWIWAMNYDFSLFILIYNS